jgi:hypothetical protein
MLIIHSMTHDRGSRGIRELPAAGLVRRRCHRFRRSAVGWTPCAPLLMVAVTALKIDAILDSRGLRARLAGGSVKRSRK